MTELVDIIEIEIISSQMVSENYQESVKIFIEDEQIN